jgi:glucokinase
MIVLAGDIGGTKVELGLFDGAAPRARRRYASRDFGGLEAICSDFLGGGHDRPAAAAFGIAGPIVGDHVRTTNLPWVIGKPSLQRLLGCPVALLNDLESTAHGVPHLAPAELFVLNEGREVARAARAILAAGTGLGEGYMVFDAHRGRYEPHASEGGHADFAPRNDEEIDLLRHLASRFGRVSVERVVSGMGIAAIFEHLAAGGRRQVTRALREAVAGGDAAAVVAGAAMDGSSPVCTDTMRLFVSAYGAEAGNLALKVMALGGVYVGGGIAPRILPLLGDGLFLESFRDKGRFRGLLQDVPVRVILNDQASLLGAAAVARELAGQAEH